MFRRVMPLFGLLVALAVRTSAAPAEVPLEQAWQELPGYEYGQDLAGQLAIERSVIAAMNTPAERARIAARFAELLRQPATTLPAKQFICLQLRQAGTPAEVPVLAELLRVPETCQMAVYALAAIPGSEATDALRTALDQLQGDALVGVIHALGMRRDAKAVEQLIPLANGTDAPVRQAALHALAGIADRRALEWFEQRLAAEQRPLPAEFVGCILRATSAWVAQADDAQSARELARSICEKLSDPAERPATRRAASETALRLAPETAAETIRAAFLSGDAVQQQWAAGHLSVLSDDALDELSTQLGTLPDASSVALIEVLANRRNENVMPLLHEMLQSNAPAARLAAVRYFGVLRDPSIIPALMDQLAGEEQLAAAARTALARQPRDAVGPALLAALDRPEIRPAAIAVLTELRYYEAIDPLIRIAADNDPIIYGPALDGLRGIADPDEFDLPRLLSLLAGIQPGAHRDEVEKTVAIVCDKLPAGEDRAAKVLQLLADADEGRKIMCLPLLGRLGGESARKIVESYLVAPDAAARESAVRALCNWPNAEVADQLLALATGAGDKRFARWALRAYVRVVSLPSDRPETETLNMLRKIMSQARETEDRALIISRAATVRTMDCVRWLATYLNDPALAQSACAALVELAHHRDLRNQNMDEFRPILDRVIKTSQDAAVIDRAQRYRLGQ